MGTLYENITSLCTEKGIKGGKMCVDLGISKSLMTKLRDNPARQITSETAKKIADYFGVSVDRVMFGEKKEIHANDDMDLTSEELDFIQWYRTAATEKDKALIKTIVESD